jgi:3-deoxy-7-phosphoheptulonate synthase
MGFSFVTEIPSPDVIRERFPLAPELAARKKERDEEIKKIITGESDKLLVVVGPCSADNEEAVVDYVSRLVKVQEKTKDRLVIVPRVYTNKPRTTGEGYMGMIHQPDPEKKPDMLEGILAIRHMHMRVLQETGFSTADEMLYPENLRYLSVLYCRGCPLGGKPVPPPGGQRLRCARGPEKPHQRRFDRYAQLCCGGPSAP